MIVEIKFRVWDTTHKMFRESDLTFAVGRLSKQANTKKSIIIHPQTNPQIIES